MQKKNLPINSAIDLNKLGIANEITYPTIRNHCDINDHDDSTQQNNVQAFKKPTFLPQSINSSLANLVFKQHFVHHSN